MKIVCLVKQVPNTTEIKIDKENGTLIRAGVESIINPDDKAGVDLALKLKKEYDDVEIEILTMGPPQAKLMLKEILAMGADKATLLSDPKFAGADTWATSYTLAAYLKTVDYDLIISGHQAIDGDTAQVGPQTAERLEIPQLTYVTECLGYEKNAFKFVKTLEDAQETYELQTPCLISVMQNVAEFKYMNIGRIFSDLDANVKVLKRDDLDVELELIGLKGSPTKVKKSTNKEVDTNIEKHNLSVDASAKMIVDVLAHKQFI